MHRNMGCHHARGYRRLHNIAGEVFTWFLLIKDFHSLASHATDTIFSDHILLGLVLSILPWEGWSSSSCPTLSSWDMAAIQVFHLFRHGFIGLQDGTVRYSSLPFLVLPDSHVSIQLSTNLTATSKARPLRTRRKTGSSLLKAPYVTRTCYEYYGLSVLLSQCNTHKSPLDPYSIFLYYTLNDLIFSS